MASKGNWFGTLFGNGASRAKRPGYPNAYNPVPHTTDFEQTDVFDPALKQFRHAFRRSAPMFRDAGQALRWRTARQRVIDHLLRPVTATAWKDQLVLRGSILLKVWFGEIAREPGDLDWVVTPETISVGYAQARRLFDGLLRAIGQEPPTDSARIDCDRIAVDDTWTYDRAPGRRIVLPWQADDLPGGTVQMDFVFNEPLPSEPVWIDVPAAGGSSIRVRAASMEQSLAWKILWLSTDAYPQGKDVYSAVLLAEYVRLPLELLEKTMASAPGFRSAELSADMTLKWQVDWENFTREHPNVDRNVEQWKQRLATALRPCCFGPAGRNESAGGDRNFLIPLPTDAAVS